MKKALSTCLFCAVITIAASAADLKLSDGRILKDYRVTAQTPTRVTVRHAGGMATIEKKLLPSELLKEYPIDAEAAAKEAAEIERGKAAYAEQARAAEEKRAAEHAAFLAAVAKKREKEEARAAANSATRPNVDVANSVAVRRTADPLERIEKAIRFRADQYYKSQRQTGSGRTLVYDLDYELEDPTPVPGWSGRYEVKGKCLFQYYDSVWGGSFSNGTGTFTAQVEVSATGAVKLVDFSPR